MAALVAAGLAVGLAWGEPTAPPQERLVTIAARQYAFDPPILRVNRGDRVRLRFAATDVTHGFYLDGHDIDVRFAPHNPLVQLRRPSEDGEPEFVMEVVFTANRTGKFRYRCSIVCGSMHPFMQGELIVEPNRPYRGAIGMSVGLVLASLLHLAGSRRGRHPRAPRGARGAIPMDRRVDLLARFPWLKRPLQSRSFQFLVVLPNLAFFYLFLLGGIFGSPLGSQNILIVFVWIFWWFLLIAFLVPFGGRIWCLACPLPIIGEWLQRLALIQVRAGTSLGTRNRLFGLNLRWPRRFRNIWLQNIGFLCLAIFIALLVTRPIASVIVLGGMILLSTLLMAVYRQRAFCMYLCPVGGFIGLYSMTSTLELRAVNPDVCRRCPDKNCVRGSSENYACPWFQYPGKMDRNNYCGLCTECMKNCPHDNITLRLRPFASDTTIKDYAEAWKAMIMLVLAMFYSVTLLGPWGGVKDWANVSESGDWIGFAWYALAMAGSALVLFPAMHLGVAWLSHRAAGDPAVDVREVFIRYSYAFVPMGLLAWIAFSIPLVLVNGSYIVAIVSDPFGWGWDLFGSAELPWHPLIPEWIPVIQEGLLLTGLIVSLRSAHRVGQTIFARHDQVIRSLVPLAALLTVVTAAFFRLYAG